MKRSIDHEKWTIYEIETAAIAQMLRDLLFLDDRKKTTGPLPRKKLQSKIKRGFKKGKELFCQKLRWYTQKRYI